MTDQTSYPNIGRVDGLVGLVILTLKNDITKNTVFNSIIVFAVVLKLLLTTKIFYRVSPFAIFIFEGGS